MSNSPVAVRSSNARPLSLLLRSLTSDSTRAFSPSRDGYQAVTRLSVDGQGSVETTDQRGHMAHLYLDSRLVRPGDILLTTRRKPKSMLIRWATRSAYSHAALCLGPVLLFEALDDGLYSTPLAFGRFVDDQGHEHRKPQLPFASGAVLFRHPELEKRSAQKPGRDIPGELAAMAGSYLGLPYPQAIALLAALPPENPLQLVGLRYNGRFVDKEAPTNQVGLFCSELIEAIYKGLDVPLFTDRRAASSVSPGALATALKEVQGGVVHGRPLPLTDEDEAMNRGAEVAMADRKQQKVYGEMRATVARSGKTIDRIEKVAAAFTKRLKDAVRQKDA